MAKHRATITPNRGIHSPQVRKAIYTVIAALCALATGYGILTPQHAELWLTLGSSILGLASSTLAIANVPNQ